MERREVVQDCRPHRQGGIFRRRFWNPRQKREESSNQANHGPPCEISLGFEDSKRGGSFEESQPPKYHTTLRDHNTRYRESEGDILGVGVFPQGHQEDHEV